MKKYPVLAVIGGSGLYELDGIKTIKWNLINTPFGKPSDKILAAKYKGLALYFLPRHGRNHSISPNKINYRANIYALKKLGVTDIISVSAVGSLKKNHKPGDFILVDQYIDRTLNRERTFFDNDIVAHVSLANPTSTDLSKIIYASKIKKLNRVKLGGTYIAIDGPQFSTYAESLLFKSWNCDVIGMTNMPEAKLAREAEIRYVSIAMVTDYDCWHETEDNVDVTDIIKVLNENAENAKLLIKTFVEGYKHNRNNEIIDGIDNVLDTAIITSNLSKEDFIKCGLDAVAARVINAR